ncbi:shikimate kinase [Leekyejoonella antrihumi]|uniref:shikimate kinase n=1 Tax=Leekyejoonella antrihumi TaxID=1660198 RepID=UPI001FE9CE6E|nr:shikimate kinase [Leekyejoonella antrihumi]
MSPRVILIGPPGAGKSTVGAMVADRLGLPFVDTDALIVQEQQRSVSDIFVVDGEETFRRLEADAARRSLDAETVLALGGGAPIQDAVAELLAGHRVLFLDVAIADASGRIGFDQSRPLLAVNPRATWSRMMTQRRPAYERLATWVVDTAGKDVETVVEEVLAHVTKVDHD